MPLDVTGGEATGIEAQHFVVEALQTSLAFRHQLRRKAPIAVAWHYEVQWSGGRLDRLLARAVAGVLVLCPIADMGGIAQVSGQLGFQDPLDYPFGQLLQQAMLSKDILRAGIVFESMAC